MRAQSNGYTPGVLMSHPTGIQNVRNALRSLVEREMVVEPWTIFAWNRDSFWNSLLPSRFRTQFARRSFSDVLGGAIRSFPWRELVRLGARGTPRPFSIIGASRHLAARVARWIRELKPDVVFAFEGDALHSLREAKSFDELAAGWKCFMAYSIHAQAERTMNWMSKPA